MKMDSTTTEEEFIEESDESAQAHLYSKYQSNVKYYLELVVLMLAIAAVVIFTVFCAADYLFTHASSQNSEILPQTNSDGI